MPTTREQLAAALASDEWTESEKAVLRWQFRMNGDFFTALWDAICKADHNNQYRLSLAFPVEVHGYRQWAYEDLGERFRKAGLSL